MRAVIATILTIFILLTTFLSFSFHPVIQTVMIDQLSNDPNPIPKHMSMLDFFQTGTITVDMTDAERSHMQDVRYRYNQLVAFITVLFLILAMNHKKLKQAFKDLKYAAHTLIALTIITTIFSNQLFILFHKIFFAHGNWTFPSTSQLIMLYPQIYFILLAIIPLILTIIYCYTISFLAECSEHRTKHSQ